MDNTVKNNDRTIFFKCELKFFLFLIIGLILLNTIGVLLQNIFNVSLLVSIGISVVALLLYLTYFIYGIIKVVIFRANYECLDVKQRISSWLSSLI